MLLRVQEVARLLNVSKWTVYRWIEDGRLRATKIGGSSLRVFQDSVNDLIGKAKITDDGGTERDGPITKKKNHSQGKKRNTRSPR
ncbi:MAG: helix-turn-helix domain-containing protein [Nitrospira sp.]|nr:helix-turn-helix domain-containing protein [Nitrospira sp.]